MHTLEGWCVIPNPSIDALADDVSVNVWNAKCGFLERVSGGFGRCRMRP